MPGENDEVCIGLDESTKHPIGQLQKRDLAAFPRLPKIIRDVVELEGHDKRFLLYEFMLRTSTSAQGVIRTISHVLTLAETMNRPNGFVIDSIAALNDDEEFAAIAVRGAVAITRTTPMVATPVIIPGLKPQMVW